mmetsp:Transcript_30962/g.81040  ORF Transcript_30962/g.81040 Transcript_30962/m.81040 type:complete len:204 (-) Transcript_30962:261-872(-)
MDFAQLASAIHRRRCVLRGSGGTVIEPEGRHGTQHPSHSPGMELRAGSLQLRWDGGDGAPLALWSQQRTGCLWVLHVGVQPSDELRSGVVRSLRDALHLLQIHRAGGHGVARAQEAAPYYPARMAPHHCPPVLLALVCHAHRHWAVVRRDELPGPRCDVYVLRRHGPLGGSAQISQAVCGGHHIAAAVPDGGRHCGDHGRDVI